MSTLKKKKKKKRKKKKRKRKKENKKKYFEKQSVYTIDNTLFILSILPTL